MRRNHIRMVGFTLAVLVLTVGATSKSKEVDWVAINPEFKEATFVKDTSTCLTCHDTGMEKYAKTPHGHAFKQNPRNEIEARDCEACHGPRSKHVEAPGTELALTNATAVHQASVCLQCHESSKMHWKSGPHQANGVTCTSCHTVMESKSETALLAKATPSETCYGCHSDIRAKMQKPSHHPVREGKMDCADCHEPHGSSGVKMLKKASLNDTCYQCHSDKRGPYVWEHAPVRESCANCHDAHGSNNPTLLVAKGGLQCLQCHSYGGHINVPRYNRTSTLYGQGCVNCHITPHGSNHPSGAKLTR